MFAAENYEPQDDRDVYRFFELFDLPNIPNIDARVSADAGRQTSRVRTPIKPYLEEKMWFALFWMQPLREFWRRELGEKYFLKLRGGNSLHLAARSDTAAATRRHSTAGDPRLAGGGEVQPKRARSSLSKVSGFSPLAGAAAAIALGADLPHARMGEANRERARQRSKRPRFCNSFTREACLSIAIGDP